MKKQIILATALGLSLVVSTVHGETELVAKASGDEIMVGVQYTANNFTEFLWGLTRPVHLWNTRPDGKREILPFWTHPVKEGGLLCWLNPRAWRRNPSLTAGTLVSEIAIVVAATADSGSGSSNQPEPEPTPTSSSGGGSGDDSGGDSDSAEDDPGPSGPGDGGDL